MVTTASVEVSLPNWQDLPLTHAPQPAQLDQIQRRLDILFLALISLTRLTAERAREAIQTLELQSFSLESSATGELSQACQWGSQPNKPFSLQEARSLVLLIAYLAQQHQELLRRTITLMEQQEEQGQDPVQTTLLGNYLENFQELYQGYHHRQMIAPGLDWQRFAFKQAIDLLFYSAKNGHRRLWLVLLDRVQGRGNE